MTTISYDEDRCKNVINVFHDHFDVQASDLMKSARIAGRPQSNNNYNRRDPSLLLPARIQVTHSIYPGYLIYQAACSSRQWVGNIIVRGNQVQTGSYESQSEAKKEIGVLHAKLKDSSKNEIIVDDNIDSSDDELDLCIRGQRNTITHINASVGGANGGLQKRRYIDPQNQDLESISIEDAVSFAYRNDRIEDTGFSVHDWASRVLKCREASGIW